MDEDQKKSARSVDDSADQSSETKPGTDSEDAAKPGPGEQKQENETISLLDLMREIGEPSPHDSLPDEDAGPHPPLISDLDELMGEYYRLARETAERIPDNSRFYTDMLYFHKRIFSSRPRGCR